MRKLLLVMAAALVACGSSNSSNGVSGMIGGSSFTPAETVSLVVEPKTCTGIPVLGTDLVGAVGIAFSSSSSGTCSSLTSLSGGTCTGRKNDRTVTIVIAELPFPPSTSPSPVVGPGRYAVGASVLGIVPNSPAPGLGTIAFAMMTALDASCAPTVIVPTVSGDGTALSTNYVQLTEVSASKVSGHVDITFNDGHGGRINGDFTASGCGSLPDVCALTQATSGLCAGGFTCL